jgi:endonuclease III
MPTLHDKTKARMKRARKLGDAALVDVANRQVSRRIEAPREPVILPRTRRYPVGPRALLISGEEPAGATARLAAAPGTFKRRPREKPLAPARITAILDGLQKAYPTAVCALHHRNAWELMVATILSAQCTDVRVNLVTPALFKAFPTPKAMAAASLPELEELIRTTGFFRNKAKSIQGAGRIVMQEFGGKVPHTMDELLRIPGVARKTANVVLGSWFRIAVGVVVDTHVLRISRRLELTRQSAPEKVEQDLIKILPQSKWIDFSHQVIFHGRQICIARKPRCADCTLEHLCNSADKTWSSH